MGMLEDTAVDRIEDSHELETGLKNDVAVQNETLNAETAAELKAKHKKLLRKIDLLILPLCTLNYFFSSMARTDIGNAKIAGFQQDNHLTNTAFSTVVALFYVGYIPSQPIGGLSFKYVEPYLVIGSANIVWGVATMLLMCSKNIVAPGILRVFIGAAEGMTEINSIYLTLWYTPEEYALRASVWYSCGVLAGSFNGLIAYGLQLNVHSVLKPWQMLFMVEGIFPIVFGFIFIWLYPSVPGKVKKFFTEEEKVLILQRTQRAHNTPGTKITYKSAMTTFLQLPVYAMWLMYFCIIWSASGYGNFLPSIINGLGYSDVKSQLLTVPMSVLGFLSCNVFCWMSDRTQLRGPFVVGLAAVAASGFAILVAIPAATAPRIAGLALIALGVQPLIPLLLCWVYVNTIGLSRRAVAIPIQNMIGQVGGLAVSYTFINPPRYLQGTTATLVLLGVLMVVAATSDWYFMVQNRKKAAKAINEPGWYEENMSKTYEELGTGHPLYKFTL